jgi:hypothetical protein
MWMWTTESDIYMDGSDNAGGIVPQRQLTDLQHLDQSRQMNWSSFNLSVAIIIITLSVNLTVIGQC